MIKDEEPIGDCINVVRRLVGLRLHHLHRGLAARQADPVHQPLGRGLPARQRLLGAPVFGDARGGHGCAAEHRAPASIPGFDAREEQHAKACSTRDHAVDRRQEPPARGPLHRAAARGVRSTDHGAGRVSERLGRPRAQPALSRRRPLARGARVSGATRRREAALTTISCDASRAGARPTPRRRSELGSRPEELAELEEVNS